MSSCVFNKLQKPIGNEHKWYIDNTNRKSQSEFYPMCIFCFNSNGYSIFTRDNANNNSFNLQAYGSSKEFFFNNTKFLLLEDSITNQPSIVLDKNWTYNSTITDSILFKLDTPVLHLSYLSFLFENNLYSYERNFVRWLSQKPLEFKIKKNEFKYFSVWYKDFNDKRNQYYSKKELLSNDSNNVLSLKISSNYRGIDQGPSIYNLTGDSVYFLKNGNIRVTNYFNLGVSEEFIEISEKKVKKYFPKIYNKCLN